MYPDTHTSGGVQRQVDVAYMILKCARSGAKSVTVGFVGVSKSVTFYSIESVTKRRRNACGGARARALARMCGACEMLRRRDNLNRTFRKCETGHFTFRIFRRFEIGHFAFRICEIGHFAFRICEIGHFGMTKYQIVTPPDTLARVSGGVLLVSHLWRGSHRGTHVR